MAYPMSMCIRNVSLQSLSIEMFRSESRHFITISRLSVKLTLSFSPVVKKIHTSNIKLILLSFLELSLLSWLQLIQYLWLCSARRYEYFDLWFNLRLSLNTNSTMCFVCCSFRTKWFKKLHLHEFIANFRLRNYYWFIRFRVVTNATGINGHETFLFVWY